MVRDSSRPHELPVAAIPRRVRWSRVGLHGLVLLLALALMLAAPLAVHAQAQPPRPLRIVPTDLPDLEPEDVEGEGEVGIAAAPMNLIIDTDPGVDDAAALIWLFSQPQPLKVLGVVTVAGNTDVDSATNNALLLLSWLGKPLMTVVRGAEKPLEQIASKVNQLIHGPDGLWYLGLSNPQNTSGVLTNASKYYCDTLAKPQNRGATVLALGPLTNLAKAIDKCSTKWAGVRIVTLGGAMGGGNQTPVSEFNYWFDPEAADYVFDHALSSGYTLEQVPENSFDQFILAGNDLTTLYSSSNPAMANLLPALTMYACALTQLCDFSSGFPVLPAGVPFPALPDPVAAIYTLDPALGTSQSALVKILADDVPHYARGQSVVAFGDLALFEGFAERLTMSANDEQLNHFVDLMLAFPPGDDPLDYAFSILDPDNATFVYDVAARQMINRFLRYVTVSGGAAAGVTVEVEGAEDPSGVAPADANKLLLPMLGN